MISDGSSFHRVDPLRGGAPLGGRIRYSGKEIEEMEKISKRSLFENVKKFELDPVQFLFELIESERLRE